MKSEIDFKLLARLNKAVLSYYQQSTGFKTERNYTDWVHSLSPTLKVEFLEQEFDKGKNSFPFMRYILELNGIEMDEYMKKHLSEEDFLKWRNPDKNLMVPKEMNLLK